MSITRRFVKLDCGYPADVYFTTQFRGAGEAAANGRIVSCDLKGSGAAIGNLLGRLHNSTPYTGSGSHGNCRAFIEDVVALSRARLVLYVYPVGNGGLMVRGSWFMVGRIEAVGGFEPER